MTQLTAAEWEALAAGGAAAEYPPLPPRTKVARLGDTLLTGGGPHADARDAFIHELRRLAVLDEPNIRVAAERCAPVICDAFHLTPAMLPAARLLIVFPGVSMGDPGTGFGRLTVNWATGIVETPPPNTYEVAVAGLDPRDLDLLCEASFKGAAQLEPAATAVRVSALCTAVSELVPQLVSPEHDVFFHTREPDGRLRTWEVR